jgi:hypothetical protein
LKSFFANFVFCLQIIVRKKTADIIYGIQTDILIPPTTVSIPPPLLAPFTTVITISIFSSFSSGQR